MTPVRLTSHRVTLTRLGQVVRAFLLAAIIPASVAVAVSGLWSVGLAALLIAVGGALLMILERRRPGGDAYLADEGLRLTSGPLTYLVRRKQVLDAYVGDVNNVVLLLSDGREVDVVPEAAADARAMLEHLGATLERRTLTAPLRGVLGRFTKTLLTLLLAPMLLSFALFALHVPASVFGWVVLFGTLAAALTIPARLSPRVEIGADGVRLLGGLRARFIAYRDMIAVEHATHAAVGGGGALLLTTKQGPVLLPVIGQSPEQVEALRARVARGIAGAQGEGEGVLALDRGGRAIGAWREALARVASAAGGFRDAMLTREQIEAVLADASAPVERRTGAALALRVVAGDDASARIRVAAETCASPHARVALEAAAEDAIDDAALDEALEREAAARGDAREPVR